MKIEENYSHPTIHVLDASKAVGVCGKLLSKDKAKSDKESYLSDIKREYQQVRALHAKQQTKSKLLSFAQAQSNRASLDWSDYLPPPPKKLGLTVLRDIALEEIEPYIDWTPFFHTWELYGKYPQILEGPGGGRASNEIIPRGPGFAGSDDEAKSPHGPGGDWSLPGLFHWRGT